MIIESIEKSLYYENNKRTVFIAYLFWIFGLHYLYLEKPFKQILYFFTFGGFGIRCIVDMFRMKSLVDNSNFELKMKYGIK